MYNRKNTSKNNNNENKEQGMVLYGAKKRFPEENFVWKYEEAYGGRYVCTSKNIKTLFSLFVKDCEKYQILFQMKDIIHPYQKNY